MAQVYIKNPLNKPFVNHKNGIRNDNRVENLEWCTQKENVIHAWDILKIKKSPLARGLSSIRMSGINNPASKLDAEKVVAIRKMRSSGLKLSEIASIFKIDQSVVAKIAKRITWKHVL